MATRTLKLSCGNCRHPQDVPVSHIADLDSDCQLVEFVSVRLKPRHWIKDTFGDGQWHGYAVADRADVARVLRLKPTTTARGSADETTS